MERFRFINLRDGEKTGGVPVRISDMPAGCKETRDKREEGRGGGAIGLRERDEKREPGKKYHLFFRHKEDKNVSSAQKQNVSIDSGCERSLCTGGRKLGAQRGKGERADKREADRWKTER